MIKLGGVGATRQTRWLGLVLAVAVVVSGGLVVHTTPARAESPAPTAGKPGKPTEPQLLPALPAGERPVLDDPVVGDFTPESEPATGPVSDLAPLPTKDHVRAGDVSKSRLVERTEQSDGYLNSDGTHTAVLYDRPMNYDTGSGWAPIDTSLVPDASRPGAWRSKANAWTASFAALPEGIRVSGANGDVRMAPAGARAVAPVVDAAAGTVTYPDAWPGVDLTLTSPSRSRWSTSSGAAMRICRCG